VFGAELSKLRTRELEMKSETRGIRGYSLVALLRSAAGENYALLTEWGLIGVRWRQASSLAAPSLNPDLAFEGYHLAAVNIPSVNDHP
jgi:hypothetical protein